MNKLRFILSLTAMFAVSAYAETVKDRAGAVRNDRAAMEKDARWIYNDFERGFTEAKRSGKPLLVVLRCVPCLACAGIDASVLEEAELSPLLDQFVCVRLINANTLDLARFQFDYDLSFSTMFFNGDGTVYGRVGSWTHHKNAAAKSTQEYQAALKAVLAIHRAYPQNKTQLAGKQGLPVAFRTPLEMPTISGKYPRELDWEGKVVQSCVHCHQISDALRTSFRDEKRPIPSRWIYPWPPPETIGLTLAAGDALRVASVIAGSPADSGKIAAHDEIISLAGQPLVSTADVSWVLHCSPDEGSLAAVVKRGGRELPIEISLAKNWRSKVDISRRVGTWPMRAMALGGLFLEDLDDEARVKRGLGAHDMALFAKHVGEYDKHAAAKKAGFQKGDVLVDVDGISTRLSESEMIGQLLMKRQPGEEVSAVVMREGKRISLRLPMQ